MTRYSKLWLAAFSISTLAVAACTNDEDLGGRSASSDGGIPTGYGSNPANDPDASRSSPDSGSKDSGAMNLFGKTTAGESCNPGDYPPAPASCAIEGSYAVTESWCQGGACGAAPPSADNYQWVAAVTVNGTEVKLTNGKDRLLKCQLKASCDCFRSSGSLIRFLGDGFVSLGQTECPGSAGVTLFSRDVGVKL